MGARSLFRALTTCGQFVAATAAVAFAIGAAAPAAAAPKLPLSVEGRWIVDADGHVVIMHGQNRVAKRKPYAPDADGFDAQDAEFLAREGDNAVRLGVIWTAVEPQPGKYDDAYLARIEQTVRMLAAQGILSVLDFHQDMLNEKFQGQGFPDWAVFPTPWWAPNPKFGFPLNYGLNPALQQQYDHLLANAKGPGGVGIQDRYADAWRHVAERFRNVPGVAGYNLMNEPWPGSPWWVCFLPTGCAKRDRLLHEFQSRVAQRIRTVDTVNPIWFEPFLTFDFGVPTRMPVLTDHNAIFSFHAYCPIDLVAKNFSAFAALVAGKHEKKCLAIDQKIFDNAEDYAQRSRSSLVLTEFGSTDDLLALERVVRLADAQMVGWLHWAFTGKDPTSSSGGNVTGVVIDDKLPPTGDNVKAFKLEVLSRPYPRVVAGTPTDWSFDRASGKFTASWINVLPSGVRAAPGAQTEIALPRRQFPDGYVIDVVGGAVSSPAGADVVLVTANPGFETVKVTVTRRPKP